MSGDFEPWDNRPSQHFAPKKERTLYSEKKERAKDAQLVVAVAIVIIVGLVLLGLWDKLRPVIP